MATVVTDSITCPKCGFQIPLTDAIEHQVAEQLRAQLAAELEQRDTDQRRELEAREEALRQEFAATQEEREAELATQATAKVKSQLEDLEKHMEEQGQALREAQAQELEFRRAKRELEEAKERIELEVARKLDDERRQLVEAATERLSEEHRLKMRERDEQLEQMKAQIDDLRRKAEPTTAVLRGEAMEQNVEELLREHFPDDVIEPVKAGTRGADILQRVRRPADPECGTILWESKRAATWSNTWIPKLKDDQKVANADIAAIVSTVVPTDLRYMDHRDGVWIVESVCLIAAATTLRAGLVAVAQARHVDATRSDAIAALHDYLCGKEFRARFEPIVETIIDMKTDLDTERRGVQRYWAKRDKELETLARSSIGMYGDLQGILGAALPTVAELALPAGD
jgi:hypothetical protein